MRYKEINIRVYEAFCECEREKYLYQGATPLSKMLFTSIMGFSKKGDYTDWSLSGGNVRTELYDYN